MIKISFCHSCPSKQKCDVILDELRKMGQYYNGFEMIKVFLCCSKLTRNDKIWGSSQARILDSARREMQRSG